MNTRRNYPGKVPGHLWRKFTDEELAEAVKRPVPDWCNARLQIARRREATSHIPRFRSTPRVLRPIRRALAMLAAAAGAIGR